MRRLNEYATAGGGRLFEETPKAVFAAVALSFAMRSGDEEVKPDETVAVRASFLREWAILYRAGIVPQRPPGDADPDYDGGSER